MLGRICQSWKSVSRHLLKPAANLWRDNGDGRKRHANHCRDKSVGSKASPSLSGADAAGRRAAKRHRLYDGLPNLRRRTAGTEQTPHGAVAVSVAQGYIREFCCAIVQVLSEASDGIDRCWSPLASSNVQHIRWPTPLSWLSKSFLFTVF